LNFLGILVLRGLPTRHRWSDCNRYRLENIVNVNFSLKEQKSQNATNCCITNIIKTYKRHLHSSGQAARRLGVTESQNHKGWKRPLRPSSPTVPSLQSKSLHSCTEIGRIAVQKLKYLTFFSF